MLALTAAQMEVLSAVALEHLIDVAVDHIRTSLPAVYDDLGRAAVRESVSLALQKAERYGLERWPDVVRYLNVMYMLGFEFDEDPRYPWALSMLTAPDASATERLDQVTEQALRECEATHDTIGV